LPLPPNSKNFLLYFYNNRISFLNKNEENKLEEKTENKSFQSLIKNEVEKLKSSYPNMEVTENFHTNVKIFSGDKRFRNVIHELLLNALEAMGTQEKQKIDITLTEKKNELIFCVRDYGVEDFDIKKAFQMYHSTKSQVGVGLNVVQSLVTANGGRLELKSIKGEKGTQATIYLPLKCFLKG
ncbi:MAG: ATP-binding protein, partial [Bdellovibrionaceae bacterium]|nr:ATP-binding protein [Pseudobdellovibrionaceae bacterium]